MSRRRSPVQFTAHWLCAVCDFIEYLRLKGSCSETKLEPHKELEMLSSNMDEKIAAGQ
jgi:hypothetical protein